MTRSHTSGIDACFSHKPTDNMERQPAERPKQNPGRWVKKDRKYGKHCKLLFGNCISPKRLLPKKTVSQNHDQLGEKSEKKTTHCFNCVVKELHQESWSTFRNKGKLLLKRALLVPALNYLVQRDRISPCISRVVNSPSHPHKRLRDLSFSMERGYFNNLPFRKHHCTALALPQFTLCHVKLYHTRTPSKGGGGR